MPGIKRLFWDIETSPNIMFSWRCGSKLHLDHNFIIKERAIICICYKWEERGKVYSLTWDDGNDEEMIKEFVGVIKLADELVAHNGDRFDMRWYNGRHLIHGLDPVPDVKTADTLKMARKHFYLNSNRLDYLGKLLFSEGKIRTNFDLWRGCMKITEPDADKRLKSVKEMVRYCKKDVILLERVWDRLRDYGAPPIHAAVKLTGNPDDRWRCPYCTSDTVHKSKTRNTAKGIVSHQMLCMECHRYYSIANSVYGLFLRDKMERKLAQ